MAIPMDAKADGRALYANGGNAGAEAAVRAYGVLRRGRRRFWLEHCCCGHEHMLRRRTENSLAISR